MLLVFGPLLWAVSGALIGVGIVAFFTGVLLVPVGLVLAVWLAARRAPGWWVWPFGAAASMVPILADIGRPTDCQQPALRLGRLGLDCLQGVGEDARRPPVFLWAVCALLVVGVCSAVAAWTVQRERRAQ